MADGGVEGSGARSGPFLHFLGTGGLTGRRNSVAADQDERWRNRRPPRTTQITNASIAQVAGSGTCTAMNDPLFKPEFANRDGVPLGVNFSTVLLPRLTA